jgi:cytochrome c553
VILLLVAASILTLCGRSASAQVDRVDELIDKALALNADPINGRHLYRKHCSSCHGRKAYGDSNTLAPALAGQVGAYVIKELADLVEGYRELPEMHRQVARVELATPQAMSDLAAFLSALPPLAEPQLGDGKQLALGGRIYKSVCADCHGMLGQGDARTRTPALRGQHYSYLLRQARLVATGHRYSVDLPVIVLLEALSLDQLTAVADFISRLPASDEAESLAADRQNQ